MPLVKKSSLGSSAKLTAPKPVKAADTPGAPVVARRRTAGRSLTAVERIDQATLELSSGLGEAASAASELQRAVDQISSGAEEAAGAAQESLGLIGALSISFRDARERAEGTRRQTEAVNAAFGEISTQIDGWGAAIVRTAQRLAATV